MGDFVALENAECTDGFGVKLLLVIICQPPYPDPFPRGGEGDHRAAEGAPDRGAFAGATSCSDLKAKTPFQERSFSARALSPSRNPLLEGEGSSVRSSYHRDV